jgi:hypothetical protein
MTTGRINQVTIVRRGWPPAQYFSAGEIFQVTGRHSLGVHPCRASAAEANDALQGNPLSLSSFPRASVRCTIPAMGCVAKVPQEEESAYYFSHSASVAGGYPPLLCKTTSQRTSNPQSPTNSDK